MRTDQPNSHPFMHGARSSRKSWSVQSAGPSPALLEPTMQGRDFSYLTVAAVAASIVLFAVIVMSETKGPNHGNPVHHNPQRHNHGPEAIPAIGGQAETATRPASQGVSHDNRGAGHLAGSTEAAGRRLFDAIRQVESAGNDKAIGDGGRSLGPYQMGLAAWLDSGGVAAAYRGAAFNRASTEAAMLRYWKRYAAVTDEQKAKCWNVGPRWRTRALGAGDRYWGRVKEAMQ